MKFQKNTAEIFIPDGASIEEALERTTDLCIAAHQDDVEIMAAAPIIEAFQRDDRWFTAVIMTDGRGSPRDGVYHDYSDDEMRAVRFKEQRKAAMIGEYAALIMLDYPSRVIKDGDENAALVDLAAILKATKPEYVYTHNLADKHATHVAVALRVVQALRALERGDQPQKIYGCEVWRSLDWMRDDDKALMDVSARKNLQAALLGVFDSQIGGGKRYDLAAMGRRMANATFFESHGVDQSSDLSYAMDLTPLIREPEMDMISYVKDYIERFAQDVEKMIQDLE